MVARMTDTGAAIAVIVAALAAASVDADSDSGTKEREEEETIGHHPTTLDLSSRLYFNSRVPCTPDRTRAVQCRRPAA